MVAAWLAERAERSPWGREVIYAVHDGAYWAWLVTVVAAVVVWLARGAPSPYTAGAAVVVAVLGAAAGAWRAWRRYARNDPAERRAAARAAWRRWLTLYAAAAAIIPAVMVGALLPVALVLVALVELAIVTIPLRARRRLLARLRIGAAAVAGDEQDVEVIRARFSGRHLDQVFITYPPDWGAHKPSRREELVERAVWDLCGPPPATPAEAIARPDYLTTFDHVYCRLEIARVPALPRLLPARDWPRPNGAIVLGQTTTELADDVIEGVPLALYRPRAHALIVGATQHGKSSGVRAWAVDALTHEVLPGGLWGIDGKGSGSLAPLLGRQGVHAIAHTPTEWRTVIKAVAREVAGRYEEILAWRSGQATHRPHHPRALAIIDEIQQILLECPDLLDTVNTLARQALEAGVLLWVLTQRPDAKDAVPGAVRDQLVDRVTFGPLGSAGAKMSFDVAEDWHRALGVAPIPGRALTWMSGAWRPVQAPWLDIPADTPAVEPLYPPRDSQRPDATAPPPMPRRDAGPDSEPGRQEHTAPTPAPAADDDPVEEILRDFGDSTSSAAYDPTDPYAGRRRRRRRD